MAEESNVHVKVAMADVLAIFVISMFTFAVALLGLKADSSALVAAIGLPVGILTIVAAIFAYLNENLLGTAIFGPLAVFFITITSIQLTLGATLDNQAWLCVAIGIIILLDAIASIAQPVKLLPILLFVAAIAFFVTALYYFDPSDGLQAAFGGLWLLYSLISFYMGIAITLLVMKGKAVLPLLIKG